MGGWASAWFALRHPESVPALALLAPALRFAHRRWESLSDAQRADWRTIGRLNVRDEWIDVEIGYGVAEELPLYRPDDLADRWHTPLLIYHGIADDTVPYRDSLAFVERTPFPEVELRLLRGGNHRLLAHTDEIADGACEFFAVRKVPASPPQPVPRT